MRKFENVDIINSLRRIMNINTEHYKNDFFLDVDTIHTAALSDSDPRQEPALNRRFHRPRHPARRNNRIPVSERCQSSTYPSGLSAAAVWM